MIRPHALFYGATLIFLALDYIFEINLRAAFLEPFPVARGFFYLFLLLCLALVLRFPLPDLGLLRLLRL